MNPSLSQGAKKPKPSAHTPKPAEPSPSPLGASLIQDAHTKLPVGMALGGSMGGDPSLRQDAMNLAEAPMERMPVEGILKQSPFKHEGTEEEIDDIICID